MPGRGQNFVCFAESERSRTGALRPFKPGMGKLPRYCPVTVVPVFIRGSYEGMPRGRVLRRFQKATVGFGETLDPRDLDGAAGPREQIVEAVRERVVELGERR